MTTKTHAHLSAETEQATGQYEFPYNRTFQAIAAATSVYAEGVGVNVSVKAFQEAFNSFPSAKPLTPPQGAQEPIYYRYRTKLHGGDWMVVLPGDLPKDKSGWEIEPLYGAPPHSPGYAGMLKEALDRFCLTQKPEHYGPEHWSNRARSSLSLSRPQRGTE
jgi:hypothetical protein